MPWADRGRTGRWIGGLAAVVVLLPAAACGLFDTKVDVLLVGDSIMRQAGDEVEAQLEAIPGVGDVRVRNAGINGSGLLTPRIYDWHRRARQLVDKYDPEVVVVIFVGNYTDDDRYVDDDGPVEGYTDRFFDAWEREAERLTEILASRGASVFWVHPPPMLTDEGVRRVDELRRVYEEMAERTASALVDGTAALSDEQGGYLAEAPDEQGQMAPVRAGDALHLADLGSRMLAAEIAGAIAPTLIERRAEE